MLEVALDQFQQLGDYLAWSICDELVVFSRFEWRAECGSQEIWTIFKFWSMCEFLFFCCFFFSFRFVIIIVIIVIIIIRRKLFYNKAGLVFSSI